MQSLMQEISLQQHTFLFEHKAWLDETSTFQRNQVSKFKNYTHI